MLNDIVKIMEGAYTVKIFVVGTVKNFVVLLQHQSMVIAVEP